MFIHIHYTNTVQCIHIVSQDGAYHLYFKKRCIKMVVISNNIERENAMTSHETNESGEMKAAEAKNW